MCKDKTISDLIKNVFGISSQGYLNMINKKLHELEKEHNCIFPIKCIEASTFGDYIKKQKNSEEYIKNFIKTVNIPKYHKNKNYWVWDFLRDKNNILYCLCYKVGSSDYDVFAVFRKKYIYVGNWEDLCALLK
jgi:hypothetical protein